MMQGDKNLYDASSIALKNSLADMSQYEPQLVANLVWHIPNVFNKIPGVNSCGVFIHQTPINERNKTANKKEYT